MSIDKDHGQSPDDEKVLDILVTQFLDRGYTFDTKEIQSMIPKMRELLRSQHGSTPGNPEEDRNTIHQAMAHLLLGLKKNSDKNPNDE